MGRETFISLWEGHLDLCVNCHNRDDQPRFPEYPCKIVQEYFARGKRTGRNFPQICLEILPPVIIGKTMLPIEFVTHCNEFKDIYGQPSESVLTYCAYKDG